MGLFDFLSKAQVNSNKQNIIDTFYSNYPEIPYISNDRDKDWIEHAVFFPKTMPVAREMMCRFSDGLLPGHIYMLHWMKKWTDKRVPAYFEYKYGIDFEKEKGYLLSNGYLDENNKPTEKGVQAIARHISVIENHKPPKPDRSIKGISKQILAARNNIIKSGFEHYEVIGGTKCCEKCAALKGWHFPISEFKIGVNAPPFHDGCTCTIIGLEDFEEYKAWLDYISNGGTTEEWDATGRAEWKAKEVMLHTLGKKERKTKRR